MSLSSGGLKETDKLKSDYSLHLESDNNQTVRIQQVKVRGKQRKRNPLTTYSGIPTCSARQKWKEPRILRSVTFFSFLGF